ncbi:augmin complex subunit msd5 [Drosophila albomicans]|uniref:Augmin complex subunit msd5 n=1 Tax=Drosophila albomicans TaxID=7291 RepID=A0A6P8XG64_DROAB|nr:augmin complex subunit msd5 [Drosophila albomicans]
MEAGDAEFDFNEFTTKFHKHFKQSDINLKELCITRSVMKMGDAFKSLQQQMQEEVAQTTPTKQLSSVAEYAELFKVLDTYPSNLQRATTTQKKREMQRSNSSTLKVNDTQDQSSINNSTAASTTLNNTRPEDERKAAEVYADFKKFQHKLRAVYEEAAALKQAQTAHMNSIAQLQQFAQQLEKLLPSCEREATDAFTASEEASLEAIAENLKQLNYMRSQGQLAQVTNCNESALARVEILVEVLSYTLMKMTAA